MSGSADDEDQKRTVPLDELNSVRTTLTQTERVLHELRIHQIELEIQNRALREAQDELESSRERYLELFDFAPMAYLTLATDGQILEINLAAARLFGLERSALLGRRVQTVVGLTDPLAFRSLLRFAAEQGVETRGELTFRTVAQELVVVEALAVPALKVGQGQVRMALHDVTSRAVTEQNLRFLSQASARLTRIPLGSPDLLDEIVAAGVAESVDGCFAEMGGVESLAWRTESLRRKMVGEQMQGLRVQVAPSIRQTRATGTASSGEWTDELGPRPLWPVIRKWVTAPLWLQGKVEGTVTLFQQLSPELREPARILSEEFARRASMILENSQLFRRAEEATRARDEMMAVLAHDLANALFSFRLHAQRGLARGGEQAQHSLGVVARGSQWLLGLVRTVLDVATAQGGEVKIDRHRANLVEVLESACLLQQMDADVRKVEVERAWPPDLRVDFDHERMLQVVFNLVNNALKFTPAGGRVQVGAAREPGQVHLWVRDSGKGLAPEQVPRAFERGWQADAKSEGKGLGLYISRRIVEAHGGKIWVESSPGCGATFHVLLPAETTIGAEIQDGTAVSD